MGKTSRLITFLAALLVLAATAAAASASGGATVTRSDLKIGDPVYCNGSVIATVTAGSFQFIIQEAQTTSGGYHLIFDGNAQGVQAATPSGTRYLIPGGFWTEMNVTPGATTSTETDLLNVIGQGGAPNFTTRAVIHTTVNAKGDVTASVDHFTSTGNCAPCRTNRSLPAAAQGLADRGQEGQRGQLPTRTGVASAHAPRCRVRRLAMAESVASTLLQ